MDNVFISEENVQTLLAMGFPSESEVRRALQMAKNDPNDAVSILTKEPQLSPHDTVSMDYSVVSNVYGPQLPPSYDEVCQETGQMKVN